MFSPPDKRIVAAVTASTAADVAPAIIWLLTGKRAKKDTLPVQRLDDEVLLKKVSHNKSHTICTDWFSG